MEEFKKANLFFNSKDDIAEAKSHNHDILQCLDVILGAMEFRLNENTKLNQKVKEHVEKNYCQGKII